MMNLVTFLREYMIAFKSEYLMVLAVVKIEPNHCVKDTLTASSLHASYAHEGSSIVFTVNGKRL